MIWILVIEAQAKQQAAPSYRTMAKNQSRGDAPTRFTRPGAGPHPDRDQQLTSVLDTFI